MMSENELKIALINRVHNLDPELSEDLCRRIPDKCDIQSLNNIFHQILAQYEKVNTLDARTTLVTNETTEAWINNFMSVIFPLIRKHRLPACTDNAIGPIYNCESKALDS